MAGAQMQPEPKKPAETISYRQHEAAAPEEQAPQDAAPGAEAPPEAASDSGSGGGGPPTGDAPPTVVIVWLAGRLARIAHGVAGVRRAVGRLHRDASVLLMGIAVISLVLGLLVDVEAFWAAAATVFSAALVALVGMLTGGKLEGLQQDAEGTATTAGRFARRHRYEQRAAFAVEIAIDHPSDSDVFRELLMVAAQNGHGAATWRLGQLQLEPGDRDDDALRAAEEFFAKSAAEGDMRAAFNLGALHALHGGDPFRSRDWWLREAQSPVNSAVGAYLAGRLDERLEEALRTTQLPTLTREQRARAGQEADVLPADTHPEQLKDMLSW